MSEREGADGDGDGGRPPTSDRSACPFCGAPLDEPGVGLLEHVQTSEACRRAFARWRSRRGGSAAATDEEG